MKPNIDSVFNIKSFAEFKQAVLEVFRYQAAENVVYKRYLDGLKVKAEEVKELEQIPFLPIEFFKTHQIVIPLSSTAHPKIFTSSGTTGAIQSKHYVTDVSVYESSYLKAFQHFYGNVTDYCILALLPTYMEREGSSLVYMVEDLIKRTKHPQSGFYLHNYDELISTLKFLKDQRTILIGVTYALLDLAEQLKDVSQNSNLIVMETGGMKGKRKEMVREELHDILCRKLGVKQIHGEYGMTELLSQAYSQGNGIFRCPPWMKVLIRDPNDPFTLFKEGRTGGINVIDLANINSCSFIATQDLGRLTGIDFFEVMGRFDNSDIRGCNLLVQ